MAGLKQLQEALHRKILNLRSVESMIGSYTFEHLWEASDGEEKNAVAWFVEAGKRKALLRWIRKHPSIEYGEMSLTRLKEVAQKLSIKNYSRLSKLELIRIIKTEEAKRHDQN
jgi:hypothetical protein